MRVFVTGAAGYIGQAVVQELLSNGHRVLGLARSDASADAIKRAGADVHRGDLEDVESLRTGAQNADGVIHLAFIFDSLNFARALAVDRAAIEAMADTLAGTGKPIVIASGTFFLPPGQLAVEDTPAEEGNIFSERGKSEELIQSLSKEKQICGSVVRLSPTTHGPGDKAFVPLFIKYAHKNGFVAIVGDGSNRWPAVHLLDAAELFRLALENGRPGAIYHAVAEQGVVMRDILHTIGKRLDLPVRSVSLEEAERAIGFMAHIVGRDTFASSERTQQELNWNPGQLGLIADIEANYGF